MLGASQDTWKNTDSLVLSVEVELGKWVGHGPALLELLNDDAVLPEPANQFVSGLTPQDEFSQLVPLDLCSGGGAAACGITCSATHGSANQCGLTIPGSQVRGCSEGPARNGQARHCLACLDRPCLAWAGVAWCGRGGPVLAQPCRAGPGWVGCLDQAWLHPLGIPL